MIASIITLSLQLLLPIINLIIRNAQKRQDLKDKMYQMMDKQCELMMRNNELRRKYDELKRQASKEA